MKLFYSRISHEDQNDERQLKNLKGFDYILSDKCSGSIPLFERPKGSQIKKLIDLMSLVNLLTSSMFSDANRSKASIKLSL